MQAGKHYFEFRRSTRFNQVDQGDPLAMGVAGNGNTPTCPASVSRTGRVGRRGSVSLGAGRFRSARVGFARRGSPDPDETRDRKVSFFAPRETVA